MKKNMILLISILSALCFFLYGCDASNFLNLDEPAFKERYEEISDSIITACSEPLLSTELYGYSFDYNEYKRSIIPVPLYKETLIDLSTIQVNEVGNVYKPGYSDFNARFCGINISYQKKDSKEKESASFLLILDDGMYNFVEVKRGETDTSYSISDVDVFVVGIKAMLGLDNAKIKVDYYGETIDLEYLNKLISEKVSS